MLIYLLILLLPLAAFSGWYAKTRSQARNHSRIPHEYFVGLNYLLNEEPDKAVDVFVKMLEIDDDTVETHLALGSLFRRRGEVNRAIRIHQNLIERNNLEQKVRIEAMLELGQDYLRAGVFDRAENLFLDVLETGEADNASLHYLIDIYQQERDWDRAISAAKRLKRAGDKTMPAVIAHYYCEIADNLLTKDEIDQATLCIKQALAVDRNCVRASLLQGQVELRHKNYKQAIRSFKRVKAQDPDFLSEAISHLIYCYEQLHDEKALLSYLRQCLEELPKSSVMYFFADYLQQKQHTTIAKDFLAEQLHKRPSLLGLDRLLKLELALSKDSDEQLSLKRAKHITDYLLKDKPTYLCHRCGYTAKTQLWQCPGCKSWNSVKPLHGIKGLDA